MSKDAQNETNLIKIHDSFDSQPISEHKPINRRQSNNFVANGKSEIVLNERDIAGFPGTLHNTVSSG